MIPCTMARNSWRIWHLFGSLAVVAVGIVATLPAWANLWTTTLLDGQARAQFDTVLVDAGPLVGSFEASLVVAQADGTVLIMSRGDPKSMVDRRVSHLESIEATLALADLVFNNALDDDIASSAYGSIAMSHSRHPDNQAHIEMVDPGISARLGPLATAVASYGPDLGRSRNNGQNHAGREPGFRD